MLGRAMRRGWAWVAESPGRAVGAVACLLVASILAWGYVATHRIRTFENFEAVEQGNVCNDFQLDGIRTVEADLNGRHWTAFLSQSEQPVLWANFAHGARLHGTFYVQGEKAWMEAGGERIDFPPGAGYGC